MTKWEELLNTNVHLRFVNERWRMGYVMCMLHDLGSLTLNEGKSMYVYNLRKIIDVMEQEIKRVQDEIERDTPKITEETQLRK